jgi:hypothetical protein
LKGRKEDQIQYIQTETDETEVNVLKILKVAEKVFS